VLGGVTIVFDWCEGTAWGWAVWGWVGGCGGGGGWGGVRNGRIRGANGM